MSKKRRTMQRIGNFFSNISIRGIIVCDIQKPVFYSGINIHIQGPEYMTQVQQLYGIMMKDPLTAQYMEAQMRFSLMMNDVYKIIGEAIGVGDLVG